jgi:chromosome segregation ATPase
MKNDYWNEKLLQLETEKHNETLAKRLALVKEEVSELQELEIEFTRAGVDLTQCKETLSEVVARNSPEIEELTERLNKLKTAIKEIDVEMFIQNAAINNSSLDVARQQNLCNALSASKEEGDLEFARWKTSQQTLIELKQNLETEKAKLTNLNNRFYELKAIPDIANLDRKITALKTEALEAQTRVSNVEIDRRMMNSRMNFLRATIAKNRAGLSV